MNSNEESSATVSTCVMMGRTPLKKMARRPSPMAMSAYTPVRAGNGQLTGAPVRPPPRRLRNAPKNVAHKVWTLWACCGLILIAYRSWRAHTVRKANCMASPRTVIDVLPNESKKELMKALHGSRGRELRSALVSIAGSEVGPRVPEKGVVDPDAEEPKDEAVRRGAQ